MSESRRFCTLAACGSPFGATSFFRSREPFVVFSPVPRVSGFSTFERLFCLRATFLRTIGSSAYERLFYVRVALLRTGGSSSTGGSSTSDPTSLVSLKDMSLRDKANPCRCETRNPGSFYERLLLRTTPFYEQPPSTNSLLLRTASFYEQPPFTNNLLLRTASSYE